MKDTCRGCPNLFVCGDLGRCASGHAQGSDAPGYLRCGHRAGPEHMIDGKCGTCHCIAEWERLASGSTNKRVRESCLVLAKMFRDGDAYYHRDGQSLSELRMKCEPEENQAVRRNSPR